jgi:pimeloyl-ACP methyl ester carboxylesterase
MQSATLRRIALLDACANGDRVHASDAAHFVHAAVGCDINPALLWSVLRDGFSFPLDGVNCPVQLLLCEQDRVIPPAQYGRRFVEEMANVAAETLPDVGHVPMVEAPEVIADAIRRHVGARAM